RWRIVSGSSDLFVRTKHATLRIFILPDCEGKLIQKHRLQTLTLERAKDRFAGYLLPPRTSLFISHDEILIVDTGEMKVQYSTVNSCLPHQTGVTERSISCTNWRAPYDVGHDVMIGH